MEHTVLDRRTARVVDPNLSAYLVPVNADVPAAIGNAIFHATGRRLRDLPFTQDEPL